MIYLLKQLSLNALSIVFVQQYIVCYINVFCTDRYHCPSLLFAVMNYQWPNYLCVCGRNFYTHIYKKLKIK